MFYGNFKHWEKQKCWFPAGFDRAMAFVARPGFAGLSNGTYEIEGRDIYALLQQPESEPEERRRFELHREYIDIQLLLEGKEKQLFAPQPLPGEAALLEDKLDEADNAFYARPAHCNAVVLQPGDYVIYLPGELHCPNCAPDPQNCGRFRKVVFKIRKGG
jgi:biofilm protein TabA